MFNGFIGKGIDSRRITFLPAVEPACKTDAFILTPVNDPVHQGTGGIQILFFSIGMVILRQGQRHIGGIAHVAAHLIAVFVPLPVVIVIPAGKPGTAVPARP